jgi:hypothetical protein
MLAQVSADTNNVLSAPSTNVLMAIGFREDSPGVLVKDEILLRDLKNLLHFETKDLRRTPSSPIIGGTYLFDLKNACGGIKIIGPPSPKEKNMANTNCLVSVWINFNPVAQRKGVWKTVLIGDSIKPSFRFEEEVPTNSASIK